MFLSVALLGSSYKPSKQYKQYQQ